ncbi:MAG: deoxyribonuclease IV [Thermoleophilia bacterium]|nr:deoxyribonuclease IV [Thermoleophilia bacterium]
MLFGAHCSGGVKAALERAAGIGADAVQLFTQSPRTWRPAKHDPDRLAAFRKRRGETGMGAVLCHAIYLVNLASPNDEFYEKSVETLATTVDVAVGIEADAVIFHVGSHQGAGLEAGLERVVPALRLVLERVREPTSLLVENSAGAGDTIGRSVDELALLVDRLDGHPRLGICLDSCHLFVSGVDVTDPGTLDRLVDEVDARIGLDRLRALHVNDAHAALGSNRDRHANVGDGLLGEKLGVFLAQPAFQGLPAVLEVPGPDNRGADAAEVRRLRELHARWTAA